MDMALDSLSKEQLIALVNAQKKTLQDIRKPALSPQKLEEDIRKLQRDNQRIQKNIQRVEYEKQKIQKENEAANDKIADLKAQLEQYKRLLYGQKRERFISNDQQLSLPFEITVEAQEKLQAELTEKIQYERKKKSAHKGRVALPDHLPVEIIEIHPEGDLSEMVCIGSEVTEELEYTPGKYVIRRMIRYKYAPKNKEGVVIADLPERVIEKGIPGAGLLASILVDKYMDHLPLYRQRQRFLREKIPIAASTLEGWTRQSLERLDILYQHLKSQTRAKGYLQADETPIKVLDNKKKGAAHSGYYWVYHNPIDKTVLFDYQPTRAGKAAADILTGFTGYLQTDGYGVYEKLGKQSGVTHLACWAHVRREFDKVRTNDAYRAEIALTFIQKLYAIERQAKETNLSALERKEVRLEKSLPLINAMGKWLTQEVQQVLPKSSIAHAMRYAMNRWDALSAYLYDGILEIDNNLVENAIRPVALGRKNYLFAGSHDAAQRAAIIYSFFAICKKHEVNPFHWLKHTLENIMSINHKNIADLYPQNFKGKM